MTILQIIRGESCDETVQRYAPIYFYPFPRWLKKWPPDESPFGFRPPSLEQVLANSFCVNIHHGFWADDITEAVVDFVARAAGNISNEAKEAAAQSQKLQAVGNMLWSLLPQFAHVLGDHALAHRLLAPIFDGLAGRGQWRELLLHVHTLRTEAIVATLLWDRLASRGDEEERYPTFQFPALNIRAAEKQILNMTGVSEEEIREVERVTGTC